MASSESITWLTAKWHLYISDHLTTNTWAHMTAFWEHQENDLKKGLNDYIFRKLKLLDYDNLLQHFILLKAEKKPFDGSEMRAGYS